MKKALVILLLLISAMVHAQSWPAPYVITVDTAATPQAIPEKNLQLIGDDDAKLTFGMVSGPAPGFKNVHFDNLHFFGHIYWFRYILKNGMSHDLRICLPANSLGSAYYIRSGKEKWRRYENGWLTPWSKGPPLKFEQLIPLSLRPGEDVYIINRLENTSGDLVTPGNDPITFENTEVVQSALAENDSVYTSAVHDAALFGFLMFAAVLNFFFFLIVRERVYLFFSIYMTFIAIGRVYNEAYLVFLREFRVADMWITQFCFCFPMPFLMLFIRALLQTKTWLPRWDRFLRVITFYGFCIDAIEYIPNPLWSKTTFDIGFFSSAALIICMLFSFILLYRKGKASRALMTAVFPAFTVWGLGWSIVILYRSMGLIVAGPVVTLWLNEWWYLIETITLCWLAVFYSWILLQRFRRLQKQVTTQALEREKEKNQFIAQQKIELEKTVKERTEEVLQQKEEIEAQRDDLERTLDELKSTQSQLIQREKMASLGELTAGIAHEIQNPLNFVNNFSEVNREMLEELKAESKRPKAKRDNQLETELIKDLIENEQKINHHGKRADFIVKGMLEHSRKSTGEKQLTDMNVLCDEFLKLAYHGMRAKDKSFNAEMVTHFDHNLPKVNVSQQDIGRVMLNLFNNAFYAVNQKQKIAGEGYKPEVSISTYLENGQAVIKVKDNGVGIPNAIKDKIMQPFFTTKPTGEGTGLGLSLSYDIIKAHMGEISVTTHEHEFTEFIVSLPLIMI